MAVDKRTRVILNNLIKNGELYGAHQKYRTSAARLLKTPAPSAFGTGKLSLSAQAGQDKPEYDDAARDAAELLYEGAKALLERGELGGGTDLALYLLDTWATRAVPCTDENRNKIQTLIFLVGGKGKWRKTIIDHATAWSCNIETPAGDPGLHSYIGQILQKDRDYYGAEHHFLAAQTRDTARSLASLLFEWYKTDPSSSFSISTLGRYAARGILSYLEASSILCASIFIESFLALVVAADSDMLVERVPLTRWADDSAVDAEIIVTKLASLNFFQLLLKTCQIGLIEQQVKKPGNQAGTMTSYPGKAAWLQLLNKYEREVPWLKEPELKESTTILAEMYFDIKPSNAGGANILGDLMSSLFGGGGSPSATSGAGRGRGRGRISAAQSVSQPGLD